MKKWEAKKLLAVAAAALLLAQSAAAALGAVAWGDRGEDVRQIQERLRQYGYMTAPADGIFGADTYAAVKYFQQFA